MVYEKPASIQVPPVNNDHQICGLVKLFLFQISETRKNNQGLASIWEEWSLALLDGGHMMDLADCIRSIPSFLVLGTL